MRNPMAMTLIGVPAKLGLPGVTAAKAAPPPLEIETTDVAPVPQPETRVPGAALTLPANPLSDLDAADLASFVEFTLLETEAVESGAIAQLRGGGRGRAVHAPSRSRCAARARRAPARPRGTRATDRPPRLALCRRVPSPGCPQGCCCGRARVPRAVVVAPAPVAPAEIAPPSHEPRPPAPPQPARAA